MMGRKRHIKFSKCPIEPHKGKTWTKLMRVNYDEPVILGDVECMWSDEFWDGVQFLNDGEVGGVDGCGWFDAQYDTFMNWRCVDWRKLIDTFYSRINVFGIVLLLKQGDYYFTTFRAYDYRKHNYYESHIGDEFWIKEVD
jgi:hypothetical protein